MWDKGRNSKRVLLFIKVFQNIEKGFSYEEIKTLEKQQIAKENWDDYIIPTELPQPNEVKSSNILFPVIFVFITSIILAFLIAKISASGLYIIFLVEFLAGLALAFSLKLGIRIGNYTNFIKLRNILIIAVITVFIGNFLFQYSFVLSEYKLLKLSFFEFLELKLQKGLIVKKVNTGSVGVIISWIIQLGATLACGYVYLVRFLIDYTIKRIPNEVIDFTFYHFIKGKDEQEIRNELATFGWSNKSNQDEVFEALDAIQGNNEINKTT